MSEATNHYMKQASKQFYVLVLGLDIIGNPFGLIRDITTGVETLFYEPFRGTVQGPEEFAEGLALGVKSLLSHAVGGTAGALSRITGTLGKSLALITLDEDFLKKRQQHLSRKPGNVRDGVFQSGKGIFLGFYHGITGVVTKPIEGAETGGFRGFFKGIGKGLIGVVARPASGILDFAYSASESIIKVTGMTTEIKKLRAPRYIHPDKIIRPYHKMEAEGNQFLQTAGKGRFAKSDHFIVYAPLTDDGEFHLIVTDVRLILTSRDKMFGNIEIEWSYTWKEMKESPSFTPQGLEVRLIAPTKKFCWFRKPLGGKLVHFSDLRIGEWIVGFCREAFEAAQKR